MFRDAGGSPVEGLNRAVREMIDQQLNAFRESIAIATPIPDIQSGLNSIYIDYETRYNENGIVSIYFPMSTYSAGAAHPAPWSQTLTYDVTNDRVLALSDLFQPGVEYLSLLSQRSIEDLTSQGTLTWDDGAQPLEQNFKSWNITSEGLHITFDPYQVSAYAMGYQNVILPWSILTDVINPDLRLPPS